MATDSLLFIAKESIVGPRHQLDRRKSDQFETDLQERTVDTLHFQMTCIKQFKFLACLRPEVTVRCARLGRQ